MECMVGSQLKWLFAVYTYWLGGLIRWDQSGDNYLYLIQQVEGVNEEDVKGFTTYNLETEQRPLHGLLLVYKVVPNI